MVLRLKTRKSRSLPGLRKTDISGFLKTALNLHYENSDIKPADAEMRGGFCGFTYPCGSAGLFSFTTLPDLVVVLKFSSSMPSTNSDMKSVAG